MNKPFFCPECGLEIYSPKPKKSVSFLSQFISSLLSKDDAT